MMLPWWAAGLIITALLLAFSCVIVILLNVLGTGGSNGRHWESAAQIYGDPDEGTDHSPRGAAPFASGAVIPGPCSNANAQLAAANSAAWLMAHSHLAPPPYLGAGHSAAMMQQAQMQAQMGAQYAHQQMHQHAQMQQRQAYATLGLPPPHAETTLKSEGVRAGEIIAWRAWMVADDDLRSATASAIWKPNEPMHGDAAGGYGIHAYKSPHGPMMDGYADHGQFGEWVIGEVALWGDVIEHERGYRAEYGRVHSFVTWSRSVSPLVRERIEKKYLRDARNE